MTHFHFKNDIFHLRRDNNARRKHAITFSCLGKLDGTDGVNLNRWKSKMGELLCRALIHRPVTAPPLIVGLAESGIIPSALILQILRKMNLRADWICSTRRPARGIRFTESHSHGPEHILPFPRCRPGELWFVEDEITTGRTLLHLSLNLCRRLNLRRVRYFAFVDTRSPDHHLRFRARLRDQGIVFSTHTLFRTDGPSSCGESNPDPFDEDESHPLPEPVRLDPDRGPGTGWHLPWLRPALPNQPPPVRQPRSGAPAPRRLTGSLLAVGEAVDLALPLIQAHPDLHLRHITLSPWEIDQKHIFNRLDFRGRYYLYNSHSLRQPLHLLFDPIDAPVGNEAVRLLSRAGFDVDILDLNEYHGHLT